MRAECKGAPIEGAACIVHAQCSFFIEIIYLTPLFCFVDAP